MVVSLHSPLRNDPIDAEFGRNLPTSCNDLSKMGHTNNGIFLVNLDNGNKKTKSNKLKLAAVFCDFQPPLSITDPNSSNLSSLCNYKCIFYNIGFITTFLSCSETAWIPGCQIFTLWNPLLRPTKYDARFK